MTVNSKELLKSIMTESVCCEKSEDVKVNPLNLNNDYKKAEKMKNFNKLKLNHKKSTYPNNPHETKQKWSKLKNEPLKRQSSPNENNTIISNAKCLGLNSLKICQIELINKNENDIVNNLNNEKLVQKRPTINKGELFCKYKRLTVIDNKVSMRRDEINVKSSDNKMITNESETDKESKNENIKTKHEDMSCLNWLISSKKIFKETKDVVISCLFKDKYAKKHKKINFITSYIEASNTLCNSNSLSCKYAANINNGGGHVFSTKPPFSFTCIIFLAIETSLKKRLAVKDIYNWVSKHFTYYEMNQNGWKNSIRHNLSLSPGFVRVAINKKTTVWEITSQYKRYLFASLQRNPVRFHCPKTESEFEKEFICKNLNNGGKYACKFLFILVFISVNFFIVIKINDGAIATYENHNALRTRTLDLVDEILKVGVRIQLNYMDYYLKHLMFYINQNDRPISPQIGYKSKSIP
ncbi:hypothetical protein A3Q56_01049 [Intoshia linei]|uniref:Fork-head domain-containing protein n=1 Tax=Intoshia linei TaxID=1819745 RepID=A0A177BAJ1_9BILA|nr:hypothetical protein A3Q56_01049 [Intoshia linei]